MPSDKVQNLALASMVIAICLTVGKVFVFTSEKGEYTNNQRILHTKTFSLVLYKIHHKTAHY